MPTAPDSAPTYTASAARSSLIRLRCASNANPDIEAQRSALQSELTEAQCERESRAGAVSRPMLGKYDRIRGKRTQALYALRGGSCGNCDTAVPLQRRNVMAGSGEIEVCEACGVLLYAEGA